MYSDLAQVLAAYAAKINGLLTGYDGTEYTSPGDAVRTQIAEIHAELDEIKERLDALDGGGE